MFNSRRYSLFYRCEHVLVKSILPINSGIFWSPRARNRFSQKNFQNLAVFWNIKPENFENSLKSPYKVKLKTGLFFDCGQPFLEISMHCFLNRIITKRNSVSPTDQLNMFSGRTSRKEIYAQCWNYASRCSHFRKKCGISFNAVTNRLLILYWEAILAIKTILFASCNNLCFPSSKYEFFYCSFIQYLIYSAALKNYSYYSYSPQ